jgi:hypothetical protein
VKNLPISVTLILSRKFLVFVAQKLDLRKKSATFVTPPPNSERSEKDTQCTHIFVVVKKESYVHNYFNENDNKK